MNTSYEHLDHGITCIESGYRRPGLAACYLLEHDGEAAFIETGTTHSVPHLLRLLEQRDIARKQVKYVIPTHVHLDHAGGVGALMQALPQAQLVVHPYGARHMIDPAKLQAGAIAVYGEAVFQRDYGELIPVDQARVIEAGDGHTIRLGGRQLLCLDAPGHARHHICLYDEQSQGIFTGDTFGLCYREFRNQNGDFMIPTTTPVQFDPQAWHQTLERLMDLGPQRAYLTHWGMVEGLEALAAELHRQLDAYVEIALAAANQTDRQSVIKQQLTDQLRQRLQKHGCTLPQAEIRNLLELDIELNSQGLEIWLQRTQDDSKS